jgi:hypothetical protein
MVKFLLLQAQKIKKISRIRPSILREQSSFLFYSIIERCILTIPSTLKMLFLSTNASFALQDCPGEYSVETWTNCTGTLIQTNGNKYEGEWEKGKVSGNGTFIFVQDTCIKGICFPAGLKYAGEFRTGAANGYGIAWYPNGVIKKGLWKNNIFQFTSYKALRNSFVNLPVEERILLQKHLKKMGLYSSNVDSLFGAKTSEALVAYNSKYLQSADLNKSVNANSLIAAIFNYVGSEKVVKVKSTNSLSKMSDIKICILATKKMNGKAIWSNNYFAIKYVAEAQLRKINCGLTENSSLNTEISELKLCQLATRKSKSGNVWNENNYALVHVKTAKTKGFKCGVEEIFFEETKIKLRTLNDAKVCLLATKKSNGQIIWNNNNFAIPHIAQAKLRGLQCGVKLGEDEVKKEVPENYQAGIEAYDSGDFQTAMEQAKLLAPLGNADAQFYMGKMYAEGKGTLQRNTYAHMWFNLASANGHREAAQERDVLAEKMTPVLVDKAQDLAAACMESDYKDCSISKKPNPNN